MMPGQRQVLWVFPETNVLRKLLDRIQEPTPARGQCDVGKKPTWDVVPSWSPKLLPKLDLGQFA